MRRAILPLLPLFLLLPLDGAAQSAPAPPTLVVFITVDQLRADYLDRFAAQFTGGLARLKAGGADPQDKLPQARSVTPTNLERLRASRPGGTWHDWPSHLRAKCHRKNSGKPYQSA